jgi:ribonuclease Y
MSLEKLGLLLGAASLVSMVIGYYLRILVAKSKKGSMELDIQQMMLQAKDKEQKIIEEAERKAEDIVTTARTEIKQKEEDAKKNEERLIKKDELLLKRQGDLDAEVEEVKKKIQEIKQIRENADKMEMQKKEELQKIARLTPEEAREEILKRVERESEEDILARRKKPKSLTKCLTNTLRKLLSNYLNSMVSSTKK